MTMTFAVDTDNDLFLSSTRNIAISTGLQAVLEYCEHAMKTVLGECVLDIERGIPDFETIWSSRANLPQYIFAAVLALRAVEGVQSVKSFNAGYVGESLVYQATIITIYGEGTI